MREDAEQIRNGLGGLPERTVTFSQLCGYNMAFFRKAAKLRQDQLGDRLGWSAASVSSAERSWDGKRIRKFDADDITAIAETLGVPVIALLLPPDDADTKVRYVLDTANGRRDLIRLLPSLIATYSYRDDTPVVTALHERLLALGASAYAEDDPVLLSIINKAKALADETLTRAKEEADKLLGETKGASAQITGDARERAEALDQAARDWYRAAIGDLLRQREELERRVTDLRAFESEYRQRLIAFLDGQLSEYQRRLISFLEDELSELRAPAAEGLVLAANDQPELGSSVGDDQ